MMLGNTTLVKYGIQTEDSDIRAHVCVMAETCYIYQTKNALPLLSQDLYNQKPVFTRGIQTATGYVVPVYDIPDCFHVDIPRLWMRKINFHSRDNPSEKGEKAVKIVSGLLQKGMFPLNLLSVEFVEEHDMQISGTDILISLERSIKVQVKCDYKGGLGAGCTGNLFLQIEECNPFGYT